MFPTLAVLVCGQETGWPGAVVLVMDLLRPESSEAAQAIVDKYAADEQAILRRDFYNSLLASFTEDDVAAQLAEMNLTDFSSTSRTTATGSSAAGLPEEGAMQRFWLVLTIVAMIWLSVSSAFALEFSAEQTVRQGAQSMRGKIYFQPDRWRVEMASPDGPKVSIHRLDKAVTWLLLPNRTYVEMLYVRSAPSVGPADRRRVAAG